MTTAQRQTPKPLTILPPGQLKPLPKLSKSTLPSMSPNVSQQNKGSLNSKNSNVQSTIKVSRISQKSSEVLEYQSRYNSPKQNVRLKNPMDISGVQHKDSNDISLFSCSKPIQKPANLFESDINLYVSQDQTLQFIEPKDLKKLDEELNMKKLTELIGAPKWNVLQKTNKIGVLDQLYKNKSPARSPMKKYNGKVMSPAQRKQK